MKTALTLVLFLLVSCGEDVIYTIECEVTKVGTFTAKRTAVEISMDGCDYFGYFDLGGPAIVGKKFSIVYIWDNDLKKYKQIGTGYDVPNTTNDIVGHSSCKCIKNNIPPELCNKPE